MKIVFVTYNYQARFISPESWTKMISRFASVMESLSRMATVIYTRNVNYSGSYEKNGVQYIYPGSVKRKSYFPFRLHNTIKRIRPDAVVVVGLRSPLQIIQLRMTLGKKVMILARHHADRPPTGFRRQLQIIADKCIDRYLFTSMGNAQEWMDAHIISNEIKIREIPAASTDFSRLDKLLCRQQLGMGNELNYTWVGRLDENKDPLTVLNGFARYLEIFPGAKLHMIFQEQHLLAVVKQNIEGSELLRKAVILHGHIPYDELASWYSAADFYISGSHREGGSYALMEAMACGCIPIVTTIPAAVKVTGNGKYAFYFQPGNADDLYKKLLISHNTEREEFSKTIENHFKRELSSAAIAQQLFHICGGMQAK